MQIWREMRRDCRVPGQGRSQGSLLCKLQPTGSSNLLFCGKFDEQRMELAEKVDRAYRDENVPLDLCLLNTNVFLSSNDDLTLPVRDRILDAVAWYIRNTDAKI